MALISYIVVNTVGGVIKVFCPALIPLTAYLFGITSAGIRSGGLAAGAQSFVGNLAPGCVISTLQSAAMTPGATMIPISFTFKTFFVSVLILIAACRRFISSTSFAGFKRFIGS